MANNDSTRPFDYEAAKNGAKVQLRDGRAVRIICFDRRHSCLPIVGLIASLDDEIIHMWKEDGSAGASCGSSIDLVMAPQICYDGANNTSEAVETNIDAQLRPFSLEAAKQGKKVVQRNGRPAEILKFDAQNTEWPLIGWREMREEGGMQFAESWHIDGKVYDEDEDDGDLFMAPATRWVNLYRYRGKETWCSGVTYSSKAEADSGAGPDRIACVEVPWT